jgi:predicted transcriptional regulator
MIIELPDELEAQLRETARAQGVSVDAYIEKVLVDVNVRQAKIAEFRAAIAERLASLDAGEWTDGEEVITRLIAGLPAR